MVQLNVLGTLDITAPDGRKLDGLTKRSRRVALLVYLAAARPHGFHRRDTLLALFWPESDNTRARQALNQSLHVLRAELGKGVVSARGLDDVSVDASHVWCDVCAFDQAVDEHRYADAMALYRGDLLDGFHISDAPAFDQWLEAERARLRQRAADASWYLADEAVASGDAAAGTRWARSAFGLSGDTDEAAVRRLMTLLHRVGDRAAAIRAFDALVERLRSDLDVTPSADTIAVADAIRRDERHPLFMVLPAVHVGASPVKGDRAALRRRSGFAATLAAVLTALAGSALWLIPDPDITRVAVLPFASVGSRTDEYLAKGMRDELHARLARIPGILAISRTSVGALDRHGESIRALGSDLGAEYLVEGSVRSDPDTSLPRRLRVTASLVRVRDERVVWAEEYSASELDEIFRVHSDMAERIAEALTVALSEDVRRALAQAPTRDPEAYDYFLRGRRHHTAALSPETSDMARRWYEAALASDSQFALAHAQLARVHLQAYWFYFDRTPERLRLAERELRRALALQPTLPEAHLALGYFHYWGRMQLDSALSALQTARRLGLDAAELFLALGNVQRRLGHLTDALSDFQSAFIREPQTPNLAFELANAYGLLGDVTSAIRYYDRAAALDARNVRVYWQKARLHLGKRLDTRAARAALLQAEHPDSVVDFHLAWLDALDGRPKAALERLGTSSAPAIDYQWRFVPKAALQAAIYELLGDAGTARAFHDSARALVTRLLAVRPQDPNLQSALALAYAGLGDSVRATLHAAEGVRLLPVSRDAWRGLFRVEDVARVYAMLGKRDQALSQLERLFAIPGGRSLPIFELGAPWALLREDAAFRAFLQAQRR